MNLSTAAISSLFLGLSCIIGCGDSGDGAGGATSSTSATNATSGKGNTVAAGVTNGAGTGSGAGPDLTHACYNPMAFICRTGDANVLTDDMCTASGQTASNTCSSTGVLGCCTIQNSEQCYYQGGAVTAGAGQENCKATTGQWSATP